MCRHAVPAQDAAQARAVALRAAGSQAGRYARLRDLVGATLFLDQPLEFLDALGPTLSPPGAGGRLRYFIGLGKPMQPMCWAFAGPTGRRDWVFVQAWLKRHLAPGAADGRVSAGG
jgi:hypothetical protein